MWLFFLSILLASSFDKNPWSLAKEPILSEKSQIYGFYSSGCFTGGQQLPLQGEGYVVVNPQRRRYYGSSLLVNKIKLWSEEFYRRHKRTVLVGDMAQPAGGPLVGEHMSHQTGLDVDLRLTTVDNLQKVKNANRHSAPSFVKCKSVKSKSLEYQWNNQFWHFSMKDFIEMLAKDPEVHRIFVSAGIKKYLCEKNSHYPAWLTKIRPEWGHTSHFHVRLKCPQEMSHCQHQNDIAQDLTDPTGVGCSGKDFASWFSLEDSRQVTQNCTLKDKDLLHKQDRWKMVLASPSFPEPCRQLMSPSDGSPFYGDKIL